LFPNSKSDAAVNFCPQTKR